MGKKIILFFIVLSLIASSVFAITTFTYKETDFISLQPKAADPDKQNLIYTYSEPLNENGGWQTTYGDAGEYEVKITVSDGELSTSQDVLIIVNKKEEKPVIGSSTPQEGAISVDEGETITFKISASDLNNDPLSFEWIIDDVLVSDEAVINYATSYQDAGKHNIKVVVSDKNSSASKEWNVEVKEVNLRDILNSIEDIEIEETRVASLKLPDLEKYGLTYSITDPIGNDNEWQTSYDDSGVYEVLVEAEGKGFSESKEVKVTVKNKDRPTLFIDLKNIAISENEEALIELKAQDPDNDNIIFSVENIPSGAALDGNIFRWKPDFDFVKKENSFDYVLDKFHLLSKSVSVIFNAESNGNKTSKEVRITVKDANRPFTLEPLEPITANEGEEIVIEPRYNDPDSDYVSFTYSGWMAKNTYKTNFDDAGIYIVKATGTDGFYTASQFVTINVKNVNRAPIFEPINQLEATENELIKIGLKANDPDNDKITFSAENLPENSRLEDNIFIFKPDFDFVKNKEKEQVSFKFFADDGKIKTEQTAGIAVFNKNRAPKITDFSRDFIVKANEPITLFVSAEDEDNDALSYLWNFGLFDKYNATAVHKRIFTSKGKKEVKVTVSDGSAEAIHAWIIDVV